MTYRQDEKIACTKDEDCDTSNCFYCLSTGICSQYNREYCDDNNCGHGDGDCDLTGGKDYYDQPIVDNCSYETACGRNNFLEIHPLLENCKGMSTADACVTSKIKTKLLFYSELILFTQIPYQFILPNIYRTKNMHRRQRL